MSLRMFAKQLTSDSSTILACPPNTEGSCQILITGTGNLSLRFYDSFRKKETSVFEDRSVQGRESIPGSINLNPGDKIIASGEGLSLFANVKFVSIPSDLQFFGPGPDKFLTGGLSSGFFGEVGSGELFTPLELDFLLGFTEGESMPDAGWLKFSRNSRILYVQKRPMRHSISWNHIYSRGAVYGVEGAGKNPRGEPTSQYRPLTKNGYTFIPRLLTGAASDPIDTTERNNEESCTFDLGGGSEWNELIYRVHQDEPFCGDPSHGTFHGGPQIGNNWAPYSNADLGLVSGAGRGTWCQETSSDSTGTRVLRAGSNSVANLGRFGGGRDDDIVGLRLVLELSM